jgi:hypothetical protein
MKYIDGIKETNTKMVFRYYAKLADESFNNLLRTYFHPVKHIPIKYYKPLVICDDHLSICKGELKWIDGQPYEIIILGKD